MRRELVGQSTIDEVLATLIATIDELISNNPRKIRKLIGLAVTPGLVNPESGEVLYAADVE